MKPSPYLPPKKTASEKFVRESKRIGRQIASKVLPTWGIAERIIYDMRRDKAVRVTEGTKPPLDEIVILLIYQPKGLLDSTIWQLEWMAAQGISAVVVSNTPLLDADRVRLQGMTQFVVERPNIGYDFGGYREGVLQVLERGLRPKALYVMNDSMWFPLSEDSDAIERSRAAPEDVWGLFVDLDWRHRLTGNIKGAHVQSYFFRFSEAVVNDPRFEAYWRKMSLISAKRLVVKLRELKLANYFAELGYSVGGLHSWREVADYLLNLQDEDKMAQILKHQCGVRAGDAAKIEPLLERGDLTALQIRDHLREDIDKTNIFLFSTALHPIVMTDLGFPFLKKQSVSIMVAKRRKLVELGMHNAYPEPIRREVAARDAV
ncbi:rhamnan synthesis F family protein [Falsirhodobacter sp. alg1]|uniref:rhamnan synthesis F family protein n=1 Tax=Falsirhodobacter sp. alg1 TaxID=1472418 RepID=UPI00178CE8E2|nr:rhamnan synthesis F family protein [Falsirhodobacter sp. alg1]